MRLHSQVVGAGPDLIILHGLFGSKQNWSTVARQLSGRFRVHTLDLRNHGLSPHSEDITYPVMADDVLGFIEDAGLARAHILGHSLGGKVAMQFALRYPDRIDRLIVVDIAPRAYETAQDEVFAALRTLPLSSIVTRTEADELLTTRIPHHATRRFLLTNLIRKDDGGFRWRINLEALYAQREKLTAAIIGEVPFQGPTLFVRGALSDYVCAADEMEVERLFPRARFETIEGAGHWVHVDAPDEFRHRITRFLLSE